MDRGLDPSGGDARVKPRGRSRAMNRRALEHLYLVLKALKEDAPEELSVALDTAEVSEEAFEAAYAQLEAKIEE